MRDRIIGYVGFLLLIVFFSVSFGLIAYTWSIPVVRRVVLLENVGSLKMEDQVMVSGKVVGEITHIQWLGSGAAATISTVTPIDIHLDYRIWTVDVGVMGDRVLAIDCGSEREPLIPSTDTLKGLFLIGPSEALGLISQLREAVVALKDLSELLLKGSPGRPSLVGRYGETVRFIDSLSGSLVILTKNIDHLMSVSADSLERMVAGTQALSRKLCGEVPAYLTSVDTLVLDLNKLLGTAESLLKDAAPLTDAIQHPRDNEPILLLDKLQKQTQILRDMVGDLQRSGLKLKVWPF